MHYQKLPARAYNSPLIEYVNFSDGSHINLIRLSKPYANGQSYAIAETTSNPFLSSGLFKTYDSAKAQFLLMTEKQSKLAGVLSAGETGN